MSCAECYAVVTNHSQAAASDVTPPLHGAIQPHSPQSSAECKFKFIIFVSYRSLSWHAPRDQSLVQPHAEAAVLLNVAVKSFKAFLRSTVGSVKLFNAM